MEINAHKILNYTKNVKYYSVCPYKEQLVMCIIAIRSMLKGAVVFSPAVASGTRVREQVSMVIESEFSSVSLWVYLVWVTLILNPCLLKMIQ